jgi:ribosomal-protein-serine acetyltransferase
MKGLELRRVKVSDAVEIYKLIESCRQYLRQWLPWVDATGGVADTVLFINENQNKSLFDGREAYSLIFNNQIVGMIDLHNGDRFNKKAEIGYWLAEQFQGFGIVTAACKTLLNKSFFEYNLNRVVIRAAVGNIKSLHIPERLGFVKEGIEREGEAFQSGYQDLIVYSMLKREWKFTDGVT